MSESRVMRTEDGSTPLTLLSRFPLLLQNEAQVRNLAISLVTHPSIPFAFCCRPGTMLRCV